MFPKALTDLRVDWSFDEAFNLPAPPAAPMPPDQFGEITSFEFHDLRIDLQESFTYLEDVLLDIQSVLEPFRELVGIVVDPLPIISDVFGDTSLLEVLSFAGVLPGDWHTLIAIADGLLDLIDPATALAGSVAPGTMLHFGSLGSKDGSEAIVVDIEAYSSVQDVPFESFHATAPVQGSLIQQLDAATPNGAASAFYNALQDIGGTGTALALPFLTDPAILPRSDYQP